MTDLHPVPEGPRQNAAFWLVASLMALIVVGGLAYGLSYPVIQASNPPHPPQTTGSGGEHSRSGHPL